MWQHLCLPLLCSWLQWRWQLKWQLTMMPCSSVPLAVEVVAFYSYSVIEACWESTQSIELIVHSVEWTHAVKSMPLVAVDGGVHGVVTAVQQSVLTQDKSDSWCVMYGEMKFDEKSEQMKSTVQMKCPLSEGKQSKHLDKQHYQERQQQRAWYMLMTVSMKTQVKWYQINLNDCLQLERKLMQWTLNRWPMAEEEVDYEY